MICSEDLRIHPRSQPCYLHTRFTRYGHVPFVVVIGLLSSDDQVRDHSDDDDADNSSDHAAHDHLPCWSEEEPLNTEKHAHVLF